MSEAFPDRVRIGPYLFERDLTEVFVNRMVGEDDDGDGDHVATIECYSDEEWAEFVAAASAHKEQEDSATWRLPKILVIKVLEKLRLAHIYILKDTHPEELPEDFKPWKWSGYEVEFAREASALHRELLDVLKVDEESQS